MTAEDFLTAQFEADRPRLRSVAYRLLGSLDDADDALQTVWLRTRNADLRDVCELTAWFTTVTARECLDQLRARRRRGEVLLSDDYAVSAVAPPAAPADEELLLAESVGRALLVVLERLSPAQRAAFVLHDLFAVPFDDVGRMLDRSSAAAKKLASRARERLHGSPPADPLLTAEHFKIADAFLAASRGGDLPRLLDLLAPDVIRTADSLLVPRGVASEVRGSRTVAEETRIFASRAKAGELALVDGAPGIVIAPAGRLLAVVRLTIRHGRITAIDIVGDPERLASIAISLPPGGLSALGDAEDALAMGGDRAGDDVDGFLARSGENCQKRRFPPTARAERHCSQLKGCRRPHSPISAGQTAQDAQRRREADHDAGDPALDAADGGAPQGLRAGKM